MPEKFGNYSILRKIATGGMAGVYLAKHSGVGGFERLVCIKRILPHLGEQEDFVKMFMDEARIAANLLHPNIAQIYEIDRVDGDYFIAMEYVHGQDVRKIYNQEVSRGQAMGMEPAARIIAGAASGLDYAHQQSNLDGQPLSIVHRDISPQNILVTYNGHVKLVDFGVAKAAGKMAETRSGVLKGKYSYMSPEQAMGDKVDARTDIFALGITLYEVTTGTRLFKKETDLETLHSVIECDVTHPSEIMHDYDRHLEAIILKALAKDRDDRYDTAGQMADELENFLGRRKYPLGSGRLGEYMQDLFADTLADEALFGGRLWEETNTKPRYGKGGTLLSDVGQRGGEQQLEETDVTSMSGESVSLTPGSEVFDKGWDPSVTPATGWNYQNSKSASMTATQVEMDRSVPEPHLGGQTAITAQRSRGSTPHLPRPHELTPAQQGLLAQLK
ncbi:MAG: serine/threonine-protein kinase, partial [Myxococcota bacterium]|nr:serine/threonine-protein kinase [Myxococcota bacterium]